MVHFSRYFNKLVSKEPPTSKQLSNQRWREQHREYIAEKNKRYYEANKGRLREHRREYDRKYDAVNRDLKQEQNYRAAKKIRKTKPWKIYQANCRKIGRIWEFSDEEAAELMSQPCHYCDIQGSPYIGIDRMNNELGYLKTNAVPCCSQCNYAKRTMGYGEFLEYLQRIAKAVMKRVPVSKETDVSQMSQ